MGFRPRHSPFALTIHLRQRLKFTFPFTFCDFHGHFRCCCFFFSTSFSCSGAQQEIHIPRRRQQSQRIRGCPLPLPRLFQPRPRRPLLRPLFEAPPVLPLPLSDPALSQSQLLILNPRHYSSPSGPNSTRKSPQLYRDPIGPSDSNAETGHGDGDDVDSQVAMVCKRADELCASGGDFDSGLNQCGIRVSHDLVFGVLEKFSCDWKPALHFFNWSVRKCGCDYTHASVVYNKMMDILGGRGQYETMVIFLEEMGGKGLLTMETFKIAFKAFASAKQRKKAVGCFDVMERHGFSAGVDTMNCLLECLVDGRLWKEAQTLFELIRSRISPDLRTYSVLLRGWCRAKNLEQLVKIWNQMADKGFRPDTVAHNTMLEGLVKCHKRSDAMKLFFVMKAKGPTPDLRSYKVLIKYLCKHRGMNDAVELVHEMVDFGHYPDGELYTALITGYAKEKRMDMVCGLSKEMMEMVNCPEVKPYNDLIILMVNLEMWDDALKVYAKMLDNGVRPTTQTYNRLMRLHFQRRDCAKGCSVWEELQSSECRVDNNSYTAFIGGLIKNGKAEKACCYLEEMLEKGMEPPKIDYNRFAADFAKAGRPDILEELDKKMLFSAKYAASSFFARWAVMMKKRVGRRGQNNHKVRGANCKRKTSTRSCSFSR